MSKRTDAIREIFEDMELYNGQGTTKTFYLWRNGIWNDTLQLDDALFELFNEQEKSYARVEEQVSNAYENLVDTVELDYDEFIAHLKDYNFNKRGY